MTARLITATFIALLLSACDLLKSPNDYVKEAQIFAQANELSKAEATLKEGIIKHPDDSEWLKYELAMLYLGTDIDKAAKYLEVVVFSKSSTNLTLVGHLADQYFAAKSYTKAYEYYIKYGDANAYSAASSNNPCSTRNVASEAYRNAGAAGYNLQIKQLLVAPIKNIESIPPVQQCSNDTLAAHMAELRAWAREFK